MPAFSKKSLQELKNKIDLAEVISSYVPLKPNGAYLKACCPFHQESTPSFVVKRGDTHYHCFGCGAHGDAITFLMNYENVTFSEAVEQLAEKFHVTLEEVSQKSLAEQKHYDDLRRCMKNVADFFHYYLLHSEEGQQALSYLYHRGFDLNFIRMFSIGLAPSIQDMPIKYLHRKGFTSKVIADVGLMKSERDHGCFFSGRITIPLHDHYGNPVAFSARKYIDSSYGPKYINSRDTPIFKKSDLFFGLNYCRRSIAKHNKVIITEGQLDCLRLIDSGFDYCVAVGGTALSDHQIQKLSQLGAHQIYLAFDGDRAGHEAAYKIGNKLFTHAFEVFVIGFKEQEDPDQMILENGPESIKSLMDKADDFAAFLIEYHKQRTEHKTAAGKQRLIQIILKDIHSWNQPVLIHEAIRQVATKLEIPENLLIKETMPQTSSRVVETSSQPVVSVCSIEGDILRWMMYSNQLSVDVMATLQKYLTKNDFRDQAYHTIYSIACKLHNEGQSVDLLSVVAEIDQPKIQEAATALMEKRFQLEKPDKGLKKSIEVLLERNWMDQREKIRQQIQSGQFDEETTFALAKEFDNLKKQPPLQVELVVKQVVRDASDGAT